MATEAQARILGGLPVLVIGRIHPAEPDVGYGESAEIEDICWLSGKPIPASMWDRLTTKDLKDCEDALLCQGESDAAQRFWARADYLHDLRKERELDRCAA
jgi:hypothetical protein